MTACEIHDRKEWLALFAILPVGLAATLVPNFSLFGFGKLVVSLATISAIIPGLLEVDRKGL